MSEHATSIGPSTQSSLGFSERHHFLLRRLHSLTGVLPIGVFLIEHLITNAQIAFGPHAYDEDVRWITSLPALLLTEIFGIWLPIAFHAVLGMVYTRTSQPNVKAYSNADNWRYFLMRVTGIIALVYILIHLSTTRWGWSWGGLIDTPFNNDFPTDSTAIAIQHAWPWMAIFYLIGTLSIVYHFANGLWSFAITWGLTITPAAQRRWGGVCAAIGLGLALAGTTSIYFFSTHQINPAAIEANKAGQVQSAPAEAEPGH